MTASSGAARSARSAAAGRPRSRRTAPGPAGGYLPLSLFGIAPIAGVGDDTITNFNVPTFFYGGEAYTSIGVVSNGYLVIGGGTSADIVFTPQHFPIAARPNNVLAPLWSDLNPSATGAGAIRIGTLTDGAITWIVIDWQRRQELRQRDDPLVRGLAPDRVGSAPPGAGPFS